MRPVSTVATQSLMLMNGEFTLTQAAHLAERAAKEAITVDADTLALLPKITTPTVDWTYGFGDYDKAADRTGSFTPLTNFISSRWQAGTAMPDPKLGYVFLTADGGHPDVPGRAVIRRWTAPVAGTISVAGTLGHGSANGNGVRGRIISSRSGKAGEWLALNGNTDTPVSDLAIEVGDTIDFITDGNGSHTSDSFTWPVTITLKRANQSDRVIVAADEFGGPTESPESIPGQIARAWQLAFCRPATNEELTMAASFVANQIQTLHDSKTKLPEDRSPVRQAMINLCQSLFGSNEFLYVD
jgi:hypothetical protein